ncbi:MAG: hypothetical protein JWO20_2230 [Candidatus Angelobacter sp.]|jgi:hypothetical protein|nr:hypothetical protein [Candidatus Angelobacter sp.]
MRLPSLSKKAKAIGTIGAVVAVSLIWRKLGMPDRSGDSVIMAEELKKVLLYAVPSVAASHYLADKIDSGIYRWLDDGGHALPGD